MLQYQFHDLSSAIPDRELNVIVSSRGIVISENDRSKLTVSLMLHSKIATFLAIFIVYRYAAQLLKPRYR